MLTTYAIRASALTMEGLVKECLSGRTGAPESGELAVVEESGGRLVVAVPNHASFQARWFGAAWFHLDPPRHLYHFPLPALERLVTDLGFRIDSRHHFSLRQNPFGWIQSLENLSPRLPRNGLYALMYRRASGDPLPFDARTRFWLRFWFVLGAPLAVAASVLEALLRSGGTVHVQASKP